jgi:cytochrome b561
MLYQASSLTGIYNERVAIILGVLALTCGLATLGSCRSCVSFLQHLGWHKPLNTKGYQFFYRYHTYYWWAFGILIVSHIIMAVSHTGLPEAGDPDANVHWMILFLGLASFISAFSVFSSCRIYSRLKMMAMPGRPPGNNYKSFFRYHSFYWLIFLLLVAGHFAFSFVHAGIWPGG